MALDSKAIISRFQDYLRINTVQPNPDYYAAANFIKLQAQSISLQYQPIEFVQGKPIVLLKWAGSEPSLPAILLNSHVDVVPFEAEKWDHLPLGAEIDEDGRIYARGTQDMKSVGMQYLEAIRKLVASGYKPLRSVYVTFVPDEEIGGADGVGRVFNGERIPWSLQIKAVGQPGHGSKLYDDSASENLTKSIEISVNMVFLKAGTPSPDGFVMNLQPSEAEAGFDIRIPPTADLVALEKRLVEEWAPVARNMSYKLWRFDQNLSGKQLLTGNDNSNPWWGLLQNAVNEAGGSTSEPEIFPASTDSRYFRKAGLPAFGFSPISNTPSLLHDHNEYLSQAEYLKGIDMYVSIIKAFTSYSSP
ncbi:hypothetical protein YC2023_028202 [Brassica napus]